MQIENPIAITNNCRYCLMCRHVCPVGHVTRLETLTPHGWGLTIQSVQRGLLAWNEETVAALYSCADCGTCRANCVTDQPLPAAIAAARAEVVAEGLAPEMVTRTAELLTEWGNPYERRAPGPDGGPRSGDVALFVGDEAQYLWPEVVGASRKLLGATGVTPVAIGAGRSNGYLASSIGYPELAGSLVKANLAELQESGARTLIVLSPGDYFVFKKLMDGRLGISWPEEVELIELTDYLFKHMSAGDLGFKPAESGSFEHAGSPFAYVDPTHAVRVPTRHEAPRALLQAVMGGRGIELFWRRDRAHPVGSGALQFTTPAIAEQLTRARLNDLAAVGARVAITDDPGTLHQLQEHAEAYSVRVEGLYELLADHIR